VHASGWHKFKTLPLPPSGKMVLPLKKNVIIFLGPNLRMNHFDCLQFLLAIHLTSVAGCSFFWWFSGEGQCFEFMSTRGMHFFITGLRLTTTVSVNFVVSPVKKNAPLILCFAMKMYMKYYPHIFVWLSFDQAFAKIC
jgi:hypothetical protein